MLRHFLVLFYCAFLSSNCTKIDAILTRLERIENFASNDYQEINIDGLLGFTIAQALLQDSSRLLPVNTPIYAGIIESIIKFDAIRSKIRRNIPEIPAALEFLLDTRNWLNYTINRRFSTNRLLDLGIYRNWSIHAFLQDTRAEYMEIPTDFCLMPALQRESCTINDFCNKMMFEPRIDNGYLLSHRLLFYQIVTMKNCRVPNENLPVFYCSLMLKEAKTNEHLQFPARDIFLEQILLCGIEGFAEFFKQSWLRSVLDWQNSAGCYQDNKIITKRTSNVISYGCSDHTTGLAAAVLALNLEFQLTQ